MRDLGNIRNKLLYIPIEIKTRELHAKILLACIAAEKGLKVVIGQKDILHQQLDNFPTGVYLYYGINENFAHDIHVLSEMGYSVVAQDEEGLVYFNKPFYQKFRISCNAVHDIKHFFAWGRDQAECIESKCPNARRKIELTGNSRLDLIRPEFKNLFKDDIESINKQFGKFILINTNFGACNHFNGTDFYIRSLQLKGWTRTPEDEDYHMKRIQHITATFNQFHSMILSISHKFPEKQFILRPHPSENIARWQELLQECPNVKVVHEGNVIPWLYAAELMIQNGCTTAIEAVIAETPTISYSSFQPSEYDLFLPDAIGYPANSANDLIDIIEKVHDLGSGFLQGFNQEKKKEILGGYITGLDGDLASDRIINALCNVGDTVIQDQVQKKIGSPMIPVYLMRHIQYFITTIFQFREKQSNKYLLHKFSGITKSEIEIIIRNLRECSGRFNNITVTAISDQIFLINKR